MSRYIDADALRKEYNDWYKLFSWGDGTDAEKATIARAIQILDAQPPADVPQWIPCNERLPKEDGDYLVTLDFAWGKEIEMGEWFEGEWINDNSHVTVAWMPLPNPWKGEADGRIH